MPHRPFSFVHASDLHLEQAPYGLAEVPESLRELLIESPYLAAERVFEIAISERADFLVLAGDVIDPRIAGPRGVLFLTEHFHKLQEHRIHVYWAGGLVDDVEQGLAGIDWPENVHLFSSERGQAFTCERDGIPLACVVGRSADHRARIHADDYPTDRQGLFTIGVCHGGIEGATPTHSDVDYWALGGLHTHSSVSVPRGAAQFSGSPQGRCPNERGPHGCTVVNVESDGRLHAVFQPTDVLRWLEETVTLPDHAGLDRLEAEMQSRLEALSAEHYGRALLVHWLVDGPPRLLAQLRSGATGADLLERLRQDHGRRSPSAWSVAIETDTIRKLPDPWYEQENMLGDFLRGVRRYAVEDSPLNLASYLETDSVDPALADLAHFKDPEQRRRVLNRVAALGVDLLTAEGMPS